MHRPSMTSHIGTIKLLLLPTYVICKSLHRHTAEFSFACKYVLQISYGYGSNFDNNLHYDVDSNKITVI